VRQQRSQGCAAAVDRDVTRCGALGAQDGGGTIALGGATLTVPATGTAALRGANNNFTVGQTINGVDVGAVVNSGLSLLLPSTLRLRSVTALSIASPGAQPITGFSWGLMVALINIPGTALVTALVGFDGVNATILAGGTYCTSTISTADRVNFYISGGSAVIQNLRAVGISVYLHLLTA
jgi:hypothetical protein